ncbi:MAG TPA: NAD(P)H-quinone oxidoreductase [Candidatus Polarisedimenticolaceae bacterium]|nr:NAD(P)H-quinone oxidoreductase [Candidatus Polarisedimenticolaceae bacterium]
MRAIVVTRPGAPGVLALREVSDPVAGPREVVVRVVAAGVNRADLLQRLGLYPAPAAAPGPGLEFAGYVAETGAGVRLLAPGDRVMGIVSGGAYAERVAVDERLCMIVPASVDWVTAAAVPETFLTAYDALFRRVSLTVGETLLLQAAGSGVGTAALQLGLIAQARIVALSRSAAKREALSKIGAQHVLDPSAPSAVDEVLAATAGCGVDVVLDLVGASAFEFHLRVLRERGRWVLVGLLGGSRREVDLFQLMRKRLTLIGTVLRSRTLEQKIALVEEFSARILPLIADGRVSPVVHGVLDLDRAAEAHALMERGENLGKIVLRV